MFPPCNVPSVTISKASIHLALVKLADGLTGKSVHHTLGQMSAFHPEWGLFVHIANVALRKFVVKNAVQPSLANG